MYPPSPYKLEQVVSTDLPVLAEIETEAVLPQPLNSVFFQDWADTKVQARFFQSALEGSLGKPNIHIIKATNSNTGVIDGYMLWKVEQAPKMEAAHERDTLASKQHSSSSTSPANLSDPSDALNQAFTKIVFPETEKLKARLKDGKRSAHLNKLFVRPGAQRQGIGSLLVEWAIKKARAEGLDMFLVSVPYPHDFYLNRGFEDVESWDIDLGPWGPKFGGFGVFRFQGMIRRYVRKDNRNQ